MLRVEEGQECAVLCAAEVVEEIDSQTRYDYGARRPSPESQRTDAEDTPTAGGADHTSGGAAGGIGSSATAVPPAEEYDVETEYGDAATATAGDGSSAGDDTETFSELSEPGGTEVVFVREGVAVVPGAAAASSLWAPERILGRLSLVKQYGVLFMAWLPYSRGVLQHDGTFRVAPAVAAAKAAARGGRGGGGGGGSAGVAGSGAAGGSNGQSATAGPRGGKAGRGGAGGGADRTLYAVHPIPLSEVAALRRRCPPLGLGPPSLTVVLRSGVTLPPLHFTRGGLKQLIGAIQQHALLLKSASEPHTYLVNDTADPLCRSLTALQLSDVLIGGPPPGASATFEPGERAVAANGAAGAAAAAAAAASPPPAPPSAAPAVTATWVSPAVGLGLAAAAATAPGRSVYGGVGGGGGDGAAVSWSWADVPAAPLSAAAAAAVGATGVGGVVGVPKGSGDSGYERDSDNDSDNGGGARVVSGTWAYGIVDAINRFVQNVRGTASGWIGAFDEIDPLYDTCDGGGGGPGGGAADGEGVEADGDAGYEDAVEVEAEVEMTRYDSSSGQSALPPAVRSHGGSNASGHDAGADGSLDGGGAAAVVGPDGGGAAAAGAAAGAGEVATEVGDFELLDGGGCQGEAAAYSAGRRRPQPPPLSPEEWAAMFDAEGRLVNEAGLRDRVTASGCAPELRREVWKHLLGMYPRGSTAAERAERAQAWQSDYLRLRGQWQSLLPAQEARCGSWRSARCAVDKDVRRTDRAQPFFRREGGPGLRALRNVLLTHVRFDEDLGYCQGMSDIAAPLLVVMRDEAEAFWAFAALMERQRPNFGPDLAGMTGQLGALRRLLQLLDPPLHAHLERRDCLSCYWAFRWLLLSFKREFKYDEVLVLWETCWACRPTRHLHIYLAVAVMVQHRRLILSSDLDFDGLLRLCVGLAGRLQLRPLLDTAEALVRYAGEAGREATAELP